MGSNPIRITMQKPRKDCYNSGFYAVLFVQHSLMGICDKERLIIYKIDTNGSADRNNPIFEDYWASIYENPEIGAHLNQLIGR